MTIGQCMAIRVLQYKTLHCRETVKSQLPKPIIKEERDEVKSEGKNESQTQAKVEDYNHQIHQKRETRPPKRYHFYTVRQNYSF